MSKLWGKFVTIFEGEERKELILFWLLLGPVFLFCSLFLASYGQTAQYDLWLLSLLGCYFLGKFPKFGLIFSLSLLFARALWKHLSIESHSWQLGLESSIALGFLITHTSFQRFGSFLQTVDQKLLQKEGSITALEEKRKIEVNALQKERVELTQALCKAQVESEEAQGKLTGISGLIETLRSTVDQHTLEKNEFLTLMQEKNRELRLSELDIQRLQEEREKLKDPQKIKESEQELLQKLNQTRVEKYQAHLINESLARLLSKEGIKAKDIHLALQNRELKEKALEENLEKNLAEVALLRRTLQEKDGSYLEAVNALQKKEEEYSKEKIFQQERVEKKIKELQEKNQETLSLMNALKESIAQKEEELLLVKEQLAAEKQIERTQLLAESGSLKREMQQIAEKLNEKNKLLKTYEAKFADERAREASFVQIRKQFEEKTELLHETRVELFHTETQLLAFERERTNAALEDDESFHQMGRLLRELEEEIVHLEKERAELMNLITHILPVQESLLKPKAIRKKAASSEQLPLGIVQK